MKKSEKSFDCVEMKRAAARRIHETLKDMTPEEELAYWERKNEEFRQKYPRMRSLESTQSHSE